MTASTGKTGGGITFEIGDGATPENFAAIANMTNIDISGRKVDEIDFTHLASTGGYRENRPGFKDAGAVSGTLHFDPTNTSHQDIETKLNAGTVFNWRINWSGAGWSKYTNGTGFVTGEDIKINVNDPVSADVTIRLTGPLETVDV